MRDNQTARRALRVASPEVPAGLSCSLPAPDARRRGAKVAALFDGARETVAIPDGVELRYTADDETARKLLEFVLVERGCCSGLSYELRFGPSHPEVCLRLTGPGDSAEAARAWTGTLP